jgi:ribosomal protein S18 acetylase RimI-like enzyme
VISKLRISKATPDDVEEVYKLYNSLSPDDLYMRFFSFRKVSKEEVKELIIKRALVMLIARLDGEVVGEISLYDDGEFSLVVSPAYRRNGIGTKLVESIIKEAKRLKMEKVKFYTLPDNIPMIKIGKRLGFYLKFSEDEVFGLKLLV